MNSSVVLDQFGARNITRPRSESSKFSKSAKVSVSVKEVATVSTGAVFTSLTVTLNALVLESAGTPLSVTFTVTGTTSGPTASPGVQVIAPEEELIVIPPGP